MPTQGFSAVILDSSRENESGAHAEAGFTNRSWHAMVARR